MIVRGGYTDMIRTALAIAAAITTLAAGSADAQTRYYGRAKLAVAPVKDATPEPGKLATSVTITAGIRNSCIQVAEVEVYSGGVNVAAAASGASAIGTSVWSGESHAGKAIDGVKPAGYPDIYHSSCSGGDALTITFARPVVTNRIVIWGRADYGPERDVYGFSINGPSGAVASGVVDATSGSGSATF